jgi:homoserine O-acetyltransferase/O-succinyltransferase
MKNLIRFALFVSPLLLLTTCLARTTGWALPPVAPADSELQFAQLGDFKLESGEVIRDCRIGYRTFGKLNDDKSNAVLFPTWASGTTEQAKSNIGPGKLIDTTKYYVIAIDALGNGVSSSPSNSRLQPRMSFPKFTIRDMVNTQHELLTKLLCLKHVKAVIGVSMGGMQTFQWLVSYPDFMDKAVPIVGSPRLAPYDLVLWQAQVDAIMNDAGWDGGNYAKNPARTAEFEFGALVLTTPDNYNQHMTRRQVFEELEKAKKTVGFDANDKIRQVQAMMALDVSDSFGGSIERAAAAVKAKVLVIVSKTDHVVTPGPALDFAHLLHSKALELKSDCGHLAPSCEVQTVSQAVADFLEQ